jgi:hypothetical protein
MRNNIIITIGVCTLLISCKPANKTPALSDTVAKQVIAQTDTAKGFEQQVYLKIDKISSGPVYEDNNEANVFYRILEIPEEENISLYAEKISIGEEGGNYKLVKRIRLTDENSVLPKFSLTKVDSLKFTDSVTVSGYFNEKKQSIKLSGF